MQKPEFQFSQLEEMAVICSDSCTHLYNMVYGTMVSFCADILFACSKMLPSYGIKNALHLLSPTHFFTLFVLSPSWKGICGNLKDTCLLL